MSGSAADGFIPAADPGAGYGAHRAEIDDAVARTLNRGRYVLGEEVAAFEREFANYLGAGFAVGVGSGTDALRLALQACGIGPGDPVITVSNTAIATVAAIELAGARPVLIDVDAHYLTIDPGQVEAVLRRTSAEGGPMPRALVAVHLYGQPCDMPALSALVREYGLAIIEDCAQAAGAALDGKRVGTFGDCSAFSFYPTKNLAAVGDGGAVVTDDPVRAERLLALRQYGWDQDRISRIPGLNSRLDELQAAILRVRLKHLDAENGRRRELAERYDGLLAECNLELPTVRPGASHVFHQYVVRSSERDTLAAFLRSRRVGTAIHYPMPVHRQPAYLNRLTVQEPLTNTERAAAEVLSLPVHPQLADNQVDRVGQLVAEFLG